MALSDEGSVTEVKPLSRKAPSPMVCRYDGNATDVSEEQPLNVSRLIEVTPDGIMMDVKAVQYEKT